MGNFIVHSLTETLQNFWGMIVDILPRLIAMAIIVIVGVMVAWLTKVVVRWLLLLFRFNALFAGASLTQMMTKATLPSPAELLARLVFWLVWITFMLLGVSAIGAVALQEEIAKFFHVLPQIFIAVLILFIGILIANFAARATLLAGVNANWAAARLMSGGVRVIIITLVVTMALERVGLAHGVVLVAFSIFFGAMMFGLALAFGLGGTEAAKHLLERRFSEKRKEEEDGLSHL